MQVETPAADITTPDLPYGQLADKSGSSDFMDDPSPAPTGQPGKEDRQIRLDAIERDASLQARAHLDSDTIADYAANMQGHAEFPPIVVFQEDTEDGTHYWLGDGWHRVEAAVCTGVKSILARVYQGNRRDALIYAAGANTIHGLRRSNADKRRAVEILLRDEELVKWSDSELARIAVVDRSTVGDIRKELESSCGIPMIKEKQVIRNGKLYTQRRKRKEVAADPKPEQQDHHGPPAPLSQAIRVADQQDGNPPPVPAVPSASHPHAADDRDQDIQAAYSDHEGAWVELPEVTAYSASVGPKPGESAEGCQAESKDALPGGLPEIQSQAPLSALHSLLDRFESDTSDFRARHACDVPGVKDALDSVEQGLQRARHILEGQPQPLSSDRIGLDVEEIITPEQPDSLCGNISPKNRASTSDGSEGDIIESPQYPKVELNHEMQPSDRLNTRQAAQLVGMPFERFKALEKSGTTPCAFHKDGPQYYSDDLFRWKKSKGDKWPLLVRGSQPLPVLDSVEQGTHALGTY